MVLSGCQRAKMPGESEESWNYTLIELTFDKEDEAGRKVKQTHEYVKCHVTGGGMSGLCHYPECKYCKKKSL